MDISLLRNEIDSIDDSICALLKRRMVVSGEIAAYKAENNLPVLDGSREDLVLARLTEGHSEEFSAYINIVYRAIFDASRKYQAGKLEP